MGLQSFFFSHTQFQGSSGKPVSGEAQGSEAAPLPPLGGGQPLVQPATEAPFLPLSSKLLKLFLRARHRFSLYVPAAGSRAHPSRAKEIKASLPLLPRLLPHGSVTGDISIRLQVLTPPWHVGHQAGMDEGLLTKDTCFHAPCLWWRWWLATPTQMGKESRDWGRESHRLRPGQRAPAAWVGIWGRLHNT